VLHLFNAVALRSGLACTARLIMSCVDVMLARRKHIGILPMSEESKTSLNIYKQETV
jgi:hypothetical protein